MSDDGANKEEDVDAVADADAVYRPVEPERLIPSTIYLTTLDERQIKRVLGHAPLSTGGLSLAHIDYGVPLKVRDAADVRQIITALDLREDEKISSFLIPPFEYPLSRWANQVIRVLIAKGYVSFNGPRISREVIPLILAKLPSMVADLVPAGSLDELLSFLQVYDSERGTANLFDVKPCPELRPSICYRRVQQDMIQAMDGKMDPGLLQSLAWSAVKAILPTQMRNSYDIYRSVVPSAEELRHLDSVWLSMQTTPVERFQRLSVVSEPSTSMEDTRVKALEDKLEKVVSKLDTLVQQHQRSTVFSQKVPQSSGEFFPRPGNGGQADRYCWYHRRFGGKATRCLKPCQWALDHPQGKFTKPLN